MPTSRRAALLATALIASGAARAQLPDVDPDAPRDPDAPIVLETNDAAEAIKREAADKRKGAKRGETRLDGGRLLAAAREKLEKRGCEAATPTFRVAAAMGGGMEAAQHELGECLVSMAADARENGESVAADLLRDEGRFWLTRAAHAGNARAQRRLALLMATPTSAFADPAAALGWALVYEGNPEAAVLGSALPATLIAGLRRDVSPDEAEAADAFAAAFEDRPLPEFAAPKALREDRAAPRQQRPPQGQRRRRPRATSQ